MWITYDNVWKRVLKAEDLDIRKVINPGNYIHYHGEQDKMEIGKVSEVYRYFCVIVNAMGASRSVNWASIRSVSEGQGCKARRVYEAMIKD